ncbi:MAG: hypothetical protein ACPGSM_01115 [Thiolinea sp.]
MDINNHGNGQQLQKNAPLLPRSRFSHQHAQVANAGQHLNNTWGQPSSLIFISLLNIIFQLLNLLKGSDHQPGPTPGPAPTPTPTPGPIQPVYGVIQPPTPQPVYGVIQPPETNPTPEPPVAQPVYGVILPSK